MTARGARGAGRRAEPGAAEGAPWGHLAYARWAGGAPPAAGEGACAVMALGGLWRAAACDAAAAAILCTRPFEHASPHAALEFYP